MLSPYTVHSRASNGGYMVRDMAGGLLARAVPTEHIRPLYHARRPDSTETAYMDYIHDKKVNPITHRDEYLVKWAGVPLSDSTWVDVADIHDYAAVTQYLASLARIPKTRKQKRLDTIQAKLASTSSSLIEVNPPAARKRGKTTSSVVIAEAPAPTYNLSLRGRLSKRRV